MSPAAAPVPADHPADHPPTWRVEERRPPGGLPRLGRGQPGGPPGAAGPAAPLSARHIRRPLRDAAMSEDEKAARLVETFRLLLDTVSGLVARHFESVLLDVAADHLET